MATTYPVGRASRRTMLGPGSRRDPLPRTTGSTLLSLDLTPPSLREAVRLIGQTFDPIDDQDSLQVVRSGDIWSFSTPAATGHVYVVSLGDHVEGSADVLHVFDRIRAELRVTQNDMFAATGIKRRTYHSWRTATARLPRSASLGRFWDLVDAVDDLRQILDRPVSMWLHTGHQAMAAFRAGDFDHLIDLASDYGKAPDDSVEARRIGAALEPDQPVIRRGRAPIRDVERGLRR